MGDGLPSQDAASRRLRPLPSPCEQLGVRGLAAEPGRAPALLPRSDARVRRRLRRDLCPRLSCVRARRRRCVLPHPAEGRPPSLGLDPARGKQRRESLGGGGAVSPRLHARVRSRLRGRVPSRGLVGGAPRRHEVRHPRCPGLRRGLGGDAECRLGHEVERGNPRGLGLCRRRSLPKRDAEPALPLGLELDPGRLRRSPAPRSAPRCYRLAHRRGVSPPGARDPALLPRPQPPLHGLPDEHGVCRGRALVLADLPRLVRSVPERPLASQPRGQAPAGRRTALSLFQGNGQPRRSRRQGIRLRPRAGIRSRWPQPGLLGNRLSSPRGRLPEPRVP